MPLRPRKIFQWLAIVSGSFLLLCALLLGAFQLAVSRVPEYRVQLQSWIGERTGLVIEFRKLSAKLRFFGPELVFDDAVVRTPDRTRVLATARRGSVGFDLWASIGAGRLTAGRFTLDSPEIGLIRTRSGRIQLVGQGALLDREGLQPFATDQLPIGRFRVSNAVVSFRDEATGRGPWSLSGVSFDLNRQPTSLQLQGDASLPAALGRSLKFSGLAEGALEKSATVVSTFQIDGEQLDLAGWADVLPDEWPAPETGRGSIQVTMAFRGLDLTQLTAKVDFADITAVPPAWTLPLPGAAPLVLKTDQSDEGPAAVDAVESPPPEDTAVPASPPAEMLSYKRVAFNAMATREDDAWKLSASDVELLRDTEMWRAARMQAQWSKQGESGVKLAASADKIVLQNLWPLLAYLPESEQLARIRAMRATGEIENLTLELQHSHPQELAQEPPHYSLQASLSSVGVQPVLRAAGISGLSGQLKATQEGGQLQLDSDKVQFALPRMFRWPLDAKSLHGVLTWQNDPAGLRLNSDELRIEAEDGRAQASLALMLPNDGSSPRLELQARAYDLNASSTAKYLPADKLSPKALQWLDQAFVAGRVREAELRFTGPTRAFPFRGGEGEFVVRGQVEGMTFDYQRGWIPATGLTGEVEFRNQGMTVRSLTAAIGELQVADVSGEFADFKTGNLAIKAVASGDLDHALQFLQTSPISGALGEQFQKLHGHGATKSTVSLWLPLKRIADRNIVVTTQFNDATASMDGFDAPVTALSGTLRIRQSLPEMATLRGQWLGGPLSVQIRPDEKAKGSALLTVNSEASAGKLASVLRLPSMVKLSGSTEWQLSSRLETGQSKQRSRKFTFDSDLRGLGIDMPYPVGKSEQEERPLRVELEYSDDDTLLARSSLGDVRALVRLRQSKGSWSFDRGGVRADALAAALPDHQGLRIEGTLDRLMLDDWFALRGQGSGTTRLSDYLRAANLRVGTLQLFGYQWPEVRGVLQATDTGWQVDVTGPNAVGQLQIPADFTGSESLTASLERLVVPRGQRPKSVTTTQRDPRSWPSLRAFVADLRVDNHVIGSVDLNTKRVATGVQIDSLKVTHGSLQGEARGQWLITPEGQRSNLSARVVSTDVGATLRELNYTQFMDAKRGEISAELSWPGGFDGDFLSQASGTLTVKAENGQLLNLQPGAGRVLGLLSVAALPRRLALDFSDLTDKGLSFDTVHGDFELRDGNAFTSNLLLRGPAAEIGIAGRTGLGSRDYDQTAVVTGNLGATLPVAGALAGGPAVGAALLLFSRVFKEPLKGIARGYYRITGTWDEPVVERVDAAEAATAKGESA